MSARRLTERELALLDEFHRTRIDPDEWAAVEDRMRSDVRRLLNRGAAVSREAHVQLERRRGS